MSRQILYQMIWGAVLVLTGIAVFFRIPQVVPQFKETYQLGSTIFLVYFSLYFLGIALISGGLLKLWRYFQICKGEQDKQV